MERGSITRLRPVAIMRLPRPRNDVLTRRLRILVPHPDRHETRRHENRQTRETHDKDRHILRPLHRPGPHSPRLSILRTDLLRFLDDHVALRDMQGQRIRHSLSDGESRPG